MLFNVLQFAMKNSCVYILSRKVPRELDSLEHRSEYQRSYPIHQLHKSGFYFDHNWTVS